MNSIFEALQRSESERLGVHSQHLSWPVELLQAAGRETIHEVIHFGTNPFSEFRSVTASPPPDSRLISLTAKESLGAETFRFLSVRLRQLRWNRPLKKLLVTSTIPEEGKTMVSGNLAATLARKREQKILLLEGDIRRPSLGQQLGLSGLPGLSEWLQGDPGPIVNIYHLEGPGFWFLPAGQPPENPLELMQSGRLSELMDRLTSWFDWIVIDSPPVLPLADTSVWTRLADGVLLVTREGRTEKRQLQRGLQVLEPSKLLGVVLNSSKTCDHCNYYQRYGPAAAKAQSHIWRRVNWDKLSKSAFSVYASVKVARSKGLDTGRDLVDWTHRLRHAVKGIVRRG
jgi:capsular exopolysaccharide synthesis family protein